jgi:hypothetical protein
MGKWSIFKVAEGTYDNKGCERNVLNYVLNNGNKTSRGYVSTKNVFYNSFESLVAQFENVNKAYGNNGRRLWHLIVAIKRNGVAYIDDTLDMAEYVISKFPGHQVVSAVHIDNENSYHAHIVVSHINVVTGKRFSQPVYFFNKIADEVDDILDKRFM